ncbi:FAD-dependent oxidoreductase [Thiomicrorhabdus sp. ZW0627]|uniref:protein disulfide oxidoreductase n=1 Tax=Thiomicrorhabdus sp. ZW0627 TaxID=3039774 RepID=UPI002436369D|nr:FAD-dependent oxidoreductase [Thiomicrorhabdus sp. ZW0627]MDG6774717.1 FAD-dependent oxidoreductase [Thiomicrorhabdus sp. ZW0627]
MSHLITDDVAQEIDKQLQELADPVKLILFTQPHACGACDEQHELLQDLVKLSDKLSLEVHLLDSKEAIEYGVDKAPATVVVGEKDYGIRFYGMTGGYEFGSLLEAVRIVSQGPEGLDPMLTAMASTFTHPLHLQVMVTLACPYCPRMVHLAHQLAVANPLIRADMVDASEFPALINLYDVHGTPLTVVNGQRGFEGALAADQAVMEILKVADPDSYERLEAMLREAKGMRKVSEVKETDLYDVIVVGAGPAGLTAALYSQRKGRHTALIGSKAGGQINDTATIENYPGLVQVGGADLAEAMRHHVEAYPVAERLHSDVIRIEKEGDVFVVHTDDDQHYKGKTVIYCAGKRNRRLNVPGEERFIGRGIAWCATCDAPLYKDKRVAVVGGGNSAFTAVRDLMRYAKEIHIVHLSDTFNADPVLVEEAKQSEGQVHFHLNAQVREYFGKEKLEGVRLATTEGESLEDLAVDGVFLEIGLVPNSAALKNLIELNPAGEVPVDRNQATQLPGLFAAGDVTDDIDKQVVIASGAGAKAALAADRYLLEL